MITGFLESGKTTFLQEVLASPDFADGVKTLLLLCEEGEVEYDEEEYSRNNIEIVTVENEEDLTKEFLEQCHKIYHPRRVFVEFNGMWDLKEFCGSKLPKRWEIVQMITLADGSTLDMYLTNMKSILGNMFALTEMVIINRCTLDMNLQKFRRNIKAINQQALLSFEDENGNPLELGKEQPPYDLNAEIIEIDDVDYGLWYLDVADTPERYNGKTVRFKGKVMKQDYFPENCFIAGRNAMTCCEDDIRYIGYICKSRHTDKLRQKQWLEVTAEVRYEYVPEYRGTGPVLHVKHLKSTEEPEVELVYFN